MVKSPCNYYVILLLWATLLGCNQDKRERGVAADQVTDSVLSNATDYPENWLTYGQTYAEERFSTLDQISIQNVRGLKLAWSAPLGTKRGLEATPLVVEGVMYVSGPWGKVFALDAQNGNRFWAYDPKVPGAYGQKACCDIVNRGVALYKGSIYVGTLDGRLVALDAKSGLVKWEQQTVDREKAYTITGAPRVFDGKVFIGNSGAEYGVRGYVSAYDALTGELVWRFYTVPGDPSEPFEHPELEWAAKTWTGTWWEYGGGGTVWDAMTYDPQLGLVYIGTGNGSPWNQQHRSPNGGDNLFLSSILALEVETGKLAWHYQTTPGDSWDFTATQQIILADLEIEGAQRRVLMQAPKNGFFYILDRSDGTLLSAEPYVYVNWAKYIDNKTGRPVENDFGRYQNLNSEVFPSPWGGHNWQPMAYNLQTGLVYIPTHEIGMMFGHDPYWTFDSSSVRFNTGLRYNRKYPTRRDSLAPSSVPSEKLSAWDPIVQQEVWNVAYSSIYNGGVLTTAG